MRTILWKLLVPALALLVIVALSPGIVQAQQCPAAELEVQIFESTEHGSRWIEGINLRLKDKYDPARGNATIDCNDPWFTAGDYSGVNPGAACGGNPFTTHYDSYLAYDDPATGICLDAGTWLQVLEDMNTTCVVCIETNPDGDCDDPGEREGEEGFLLNAYWFRACVCRLNACL